MGSHKKSKKTTKKNHKKRGGFGPFWRTSKAATDSIETTAKKPSFINKMKSFIPSKKSSSLASNENSQRRNSVSSNGSSFELGELNDESGVSYQGTPKQIDFRRNSSSTLNTEEEKPAELKKTTDEKKTLMSRLFSTFSTIQKQNIQLATNAKTQKELQTKIKKFKRELLNEDKLTNKIIGMLIISDTKLSDIKNNSKPENGESVSAVPPPATTRQFSKLELKDEDKNMTIEETVKTQIRLIASSFKNFQLAVDNVLYYLTKTQTNEVQNYIKLNLEEIYKNITYIDLQYFVLMKTCLLGIPFGDQILNYQSYDALESYFNENLTLYFYELYNKLSYNFENEQLEIKNFYNNIKQNKGQIKLNAFDLFLSDFLSNLDADLYNIDNIIIKNLNKLNFTNEYQNSVKSVAEQILNKRENTSELISLNLNNTNAIQEVNNNLSEETIDTLKKYVYTEKLDFFNEVFKIPCEKNLTLLFRLLVPDYSYEQYKKETSSTTKDIFAKYYNTFKLVEDNLLPKMNVKASGGAYFGLVKNRSAQSYQNEFWNYLEMKVNSALAEIYKQNKEVFNSEALNQTISDVEGKVSLEFKDIFKNIFENLIKLVPESISEPERHRVSGLSRKTLTNEQELKNISFKTIPQVEKTALATSITKQIRDEYELKLNEIGKKIVPKYVAYLKKKIEYFKARKGVSTNGKSSFMISPGKYLKQGLSQNVGKAISSAKTATTKAMSSAYTATTDAMSSAYTATTDAMSSAKISGMSLIQACGNFIKEYGPTGMKWLAYIILSPAVLGLAVAGLGIVASLITVLGSAWVVYAILYCVGNGMFKLYGFSENFLSYVGSELYNLYLYRDINTSEAKEILEVIGNTYPTDTSERNAILHITAIKYGIRGEYLDELKPQFLLFDKRKTEEILLKLGINGEGIDIYGPEFEELFSKFKLLHYEAKKLQKLLDKQIKIGLPENKSNNPTYEGNTTNTIAKFEKSKKIKVMSEIQKQYKEMESFFSEIEYQYFRLMKNILFGKSLGEQIKIFKNMDDLEKILNFTLTKCYLPLCNKKYLDLTKVNLIDLNKIIIFEIGYKIPGTKNTTVMDKYYVRKELHSYDMIIFFLFAFNCKKIFSLQEPFELFPGYTNSKKLTNYQKHKNPKYMFAFERNVPKTSNKDVQRSYAEKVTNMVLNEERLNGFKEAIYKLERIKLNTNHSNTNKYNKLKNSFYKKIYDTCKIVLLNFIAVQKKKEQTFKELFFQDMNLKGTNKPSDYCGNEVYTLKNLRRQKIKSKYKTERDEVLGKAEKDKSRRIIRQDKLTELRNQVPTPTSVIKQVPTSTSVSKLFFGQGGTNQ